MQNFSSTKIPVYVYLFLIAIALACFSCSSDDSNDMDNQGGTDNPIIDNPDPDPTDGDGNFDENFALDKDNRFVNYVLPAVDYDKFLQGDGDFEMVSKKVYESFNDDFDFIFILSDEENKPDGLYFGITRKIKNDVEGIGSRLYDNTSTYGSQGALKSIIHMPATKFVRNGPFLHEIVHYWGNYGFIPTTVGGHWGYSSVGGQLGGFDELVTITGNEYKGRLNGRDGFGVNANGGNSIPYSNLELYIMGLIGADELASVQVAENPVRSATERGVFTADNITTYTATDLIARNGERMPSTQNAQKAFKGIAVVLSKTKLSDEKRAELNTNLENFSRNEAPDTSWGLVNFWQATGERATLDVTISQENIK